MTALSLQKLSSDPLTPLPSAQTLSEHLLAYEFPAGFAERLAREHGWTPTFTQDVLREYRRFVVLAATCGQSVTPSQFVDAAWHEHLTHTRDYWLRLTPLLPAPLHHDPAGGSAAGSAHFAQQYPRTLDLYRAQFGEPNPAIWPDPRLTAPQRAKRSFPRWLAVLALWVVGGAALHRFGLWAVAGLLLLGFVLLSRSSGHSGGRRRGGPGWSSEDARRLSQLLGLVRGRGQ